jgi:hypothetical protein
MIGPLKRVPRSDLPPCAGRYVHHRRPRCPQCCSTSLRSYKTLRNGDGSVTRYTACKGCGHRFILVLE